ncbi:hypothetical protein Taro_012982 [Colocasia esculenta]|uniref:Transcription repressor n=1 Tax=Colocasia esculenta TaxID=4460 RepID=A0A843UA98_COLES|nr:hypothetical protein [Colocasia esculenta]
MPPQTTGAAKASTSSPTTAPKKKLGSSSSIFSLKCGCKDAKSVSVSSTRSDGSHKATAAADPTAAANFSGRHHHPPALSTRPETSSADTITFTTATTSTSHDDDEEDDDNDSPSFSGLLRQLSDLERSVAAWDLRRESSCSWAPVGGRGRTEEEEDEEGEGGKVRRHSTHLVGYDKVREKAAAGFDGKGSSPQRDQRRPRHRRTQSEGGGGRVRGKVGESVAVVKQTEDPLGDFRRSMLQMIVEKEILSGEELQELLCRFLALNSPSHHSLIIRAFADIWRDVFSGYGSSPKAADLLVPPSVRRQGLPLDRRSRHYYQRRPSV